MLLKVCVSWCRPPTQAFSARPLPTGMARFVGVFRSCQPGCAFLRTLGCSSFYNPGVMLRYLVPALALAATLPLAAQQPSAAPQAFTAADYARAEKFMGYNTTPLVLHSGVRPNWLPGTEDRFWYRVPTTVDNGAEFLLVDPAKGTRQPAFDHVKVAAALSTSAEQKY